MTESPCEDRGMSETKDPAPETAPSTTDTKPNESPAVLSYFARERHQTAYGLLLAAAVFAALTVMTVNWWLPDLAWPLGILGVLLAVSIGLIGLIRLFHEPGEGQELDAARVTVLALGGSIGFSVALASGILAYVWWDDLMGWLGESGPGKNAWHGAVAFGALVGGLLLMFASLQLARTEERSNPSLRRLLYGYNAVLAGLLVVAILVVMNIFVANSKAGKAPLYFTAAGNYTLS